MPTSPKRARAGTNAAAVVCLAMLVVAAGSIAAQSPSDVRAEALARLAALDREGALQVLDRGLERTPNDGVLLALRGRVLWELKRTASAIATLERAGQDTTARAEAQYWLGRIFMFRGWQQEGAFPGWHDEPEYRERALTALRSAATADPKRPELQVAFGDALMYADRASEALSAYDAALALDASVNSARVGRFKALGALGRKDELATEVRQAGQQGNQASLGAAREASVMLGLASEADALAARLVQEFPTSEAARAVLLERIQAARRARDYDAVIAQGEQCERQFPLNALPPALFDALLEAYLAKGSPPVATIVGIIDKRLRVQPDAPAHLAAANQLASRGLALDKAIELAEQALRASEVFIEENVGAYKMDGKVRGSQNRSRAAALDVMGWALFQKKDTAGASERLAEADRLSAGLDMANQYHLAELKKAGDDLEGAREYYLRALTLAVGPPPVRDAAQKGLADVYAKLGNQPAEFERYLAGELDRRREDRRLSALRSMVDREAPALTLQDLTGKPVEIGSQRGKILLLNFFASW